MGERATAVGRGSRGTVLVIEDNDPFRRIVVRMLADAGWASSDFAGVQDALAALRSAATPPDIVLTDMNLPDGSGLDIIEEVVRDRPETVPVLMTAEATIGSAVEAMRRGAYDYLVKPFPRPQDLIETLTRATEHKRLRDRNRFLERKLDVRERFRGIVGTSPAMRALLATVDAVAPTLATVLLLGESGTGKEIIARAIHDRSARHARPFIALDCGVLAESVLESELFGHARGAFTGATNARKGIFEEADGGTVFLDEIGELPMPMQARLLRVLQEREVRPVGANAPRAVDVRVVAATNRPLADDVKAERFRADLFYRLAVVTVDLPPLRERVEDIPLLVQHFVQKHAARHGLAVPGIHAAAVDALCAYRWPGNVRELENAVERGVVLSQSGTVSVSTLPAVVRTNAPMLAATDAGGPPAESFRAACDAFERSYLQRALAAAEGRIAEAGNIAGVDPSNLRRLLKRHALLPSTKG